MSAKELASIDRGVALNRLDLAYAVALLAYIWTCIGSCSLRVRTQPVHRNPIACVRPARFVHRHDPPASAASRAEILLSLHYAHSFEIVGSWHN